VKRAIPKHRPRIRQPRAPVEVIKVNPAVWAEAVRRANGDKRRLQIQRDGGVLVRNQ